MVKKPRKLSAYNRFIARELKGKTGAGYKGRFKAAVLKWKRSNKSGSKPRAKAKSSSKSKPRARARPKPKSTGGRKMAGFNTQKIFKYIRLAALAGPAVSQAMTNYPPQAKVANALEMYTGFNFQTGTFNAAKLGQGYGPYLAAVVATYGIPKLAGMIRGL